MYDPIAFQGRSRRKRYFEGWYFKHVSPSGFTFSVIPGISIDPDGNGHAFIQVIRGSDGKTQYIRYNCSDFSAETGRFAVQIAGSYFSRQEIRLDIPEAFGGIVGHLEYHDARRLSVTAFRPGIMGWFRRVPAMECYHEVGSVYHRISGSLQIGGVDFSLDGGRGYLEKDWGSSMPSAWIWMQCNGFTDPKLSFMLSVAKIPWMGRSFTGFLGYLVDGEREIPFGTYTNAKVSCESVTDREVVLTVAMKRYALSITASRERTGSLQAPLSGVMDRRIAESLDGAFHLRLFDREKDRAGRVLIDDTGFFGGLEVAGEPSELFPFKNTR